jgi:hypothetical protein
MKAKKTNFFKFRGRFDFSPHRYEIGRPIIQNREAEDNFLLLRLYEIDESEFSDYYKFHLEDFLKSFPEQEEAFFYSVEDIISTRIRYFQRQDPFGSNHAANNERIRQLRGFQEFLTTIDQWHKSKPIETIVSEKDEQITLLKAKIEELENQLDEFAAFEASEKIKINKGNLSAFMDLMQQLQRLILPNGNKLLSAQAYSPWYKMIAKNFLHGDKPIALATAQHYFCSPESSKYIFIAKKEKMFEIKQSTEKD